MPSLDLSEAVQDGVNVIDLRGELDVSTVRVLHPRLQGVLGERTRVVLDCMGLTFIDSSGMRLLLTALRQVNRRAGRLVVACANPTVLRLFAVTGMDRTFDIAESRAAAVELAAGELAGNGRP